MSISYPLFVNLTGRDPGPTPSIVVRPASPGPSRGCLHSARLQFGIRQEARSCSLQSYPQTRPGPAALHPCLSDVLGPDPLRQPDLWDHQDAAQEGGTGILPGLWVSFELGWGLKNQPAVPAAGSRDHPQSTHLNYRWLPAPCRLNCPLSALGSAAFPTRQCPSLAWR